jgi:hypothetical protein
MTRFFLVPLAVVLWVTWSAPRGSRADETVAPASASTTSAAPAAPVKPAKARNPKGKRSREKEIEGTEARDRFQADTVIKSKYQFNGEQLEVDPD